jgi:caffeoyl-CoA O-methyltransferase
MAGPKSFHLSPEIHQYIVAHGTPPDDIAQGLIEETQRLGGISMMQIAPEQGAFMTLLTRLLGVRNAVEVGTFTGYSALCIARGLPDDGTLLCCDINDEWTRVGRPYWEKAGVAQKIDLRLAPAIETLRSLPETPHFGLAFIDADKTSYGAYFDELLPRMTPNGVMLIDNVLWGGSVVDESRQDDDTNAIRAFNDKVVADDRVECSMLAVSDGLSMIRVKG